MASTKEYLDFVLDQLEGIPEITYRKMMGEYILYYRGKIMGGIYDDRLLVKNIAGMLLVEEVENRTLLHDLFEVLYKDLPAPKKKKKQ